ncbi:MAG TPA: hypothetical protein DCF94_00790 [Gammaproteobacteria bacterium]|nr:hypothetical protein [Gammaproteobacteria bacterium]
MESSPKGMKQWPMLLPDYLKPKLDPQIYGELCLNILQNFLHPGLRGIIGVIIALSVWFNPSLCHTVSYE